MSETDWKARLSNSSRHNGDEFFILAKDGESIVGIVGAQVIDSNSWKLHSVYVKPSYRGQGIGTVLLKKIIEHIEIQFCGWKIELTVNTRQESAIGLYEKCGFSIQEIVDNQISGDGVAYTKLTMHRNFCPLTIQK